MNGSDIVTRTVVIDNQREIGVSLHPSGRFTMSMEDPTTVAIVEIPVDKMRELAQLLVDLTDA